MKKLKEITNGTVGYNIYSTKNKEMIYSHNEMEIFPLASAGKLAVGFAVSKWIEEGTVDWADKIEHLSLDPNEDSRILYPHFQGRNTWTLSDAVEVMIACHDSVASTGIANHFGGWSNIYEKVQSEFPGIHVSSDPEGIPEHFHHHMTGGLHHAILDVGMIGDFTSYPLLYVIGAKELPDRNQHSATDEKLMEVLKDLYRAYMEQG